MTILLSLALPATAAAETFEVGPTPGTKHTSATVLQQGETYTITVSGTIAVTHTSYKPPYHETYDANYCTETDWPDRKKYCVPTMPDPSISAGQGFNYAIRLNTTADNKPVPYAAGHSYTVKIKAQKTAPVEFLTRPSSPSSDQVWTGAFTVTITAPGAKLCRGTVATIVGEDEPGPVNRIIGTKGDDVIVGTGARDLILGGGGEDTICALGGADHVDGGGSDDTISGGPGDDTVVGGVEDGDDELYGDAGDDDLRGGDGADDLEGGPGDDELDGGKFAGEPGDADALDGGAGNDTFVSRSGHTLITFGRSPVAVRVDLAKGTARGWGNDTIRGPIHAVFGSPFADALAGSSEGEGLYGAAGDDRIVGRAGNDRIFGGEGQDTVNGGAGTDRCAEAEAATACEDPPAGV